MDCLDLIFLVEESYLYLFIPGGKLLAHKVSYATTSSVEFTRPLSTCYLVRQRSTGQTVHTTHGVTQQPKTRGVNL